jgi:uncharacterized protein (DUF1800 family)
MKRHGYLVGLSALAVVAFTLAGQAAGRFNQKLPADKRVVQVMNRLTFGPRPGDTEKVRRLGVEKWIDQQLHPDSIPENPILETRLASLRTVNLPTWQILEQYPATPAVLAARSPSVVAYTSLPQPQINRLVNGSVEDRQTILNSMDPATRSLILAGAPPQVLEGLPESLKQEAARVKQAEQDERQKEFRRLNPPLNEQLAGEQLRIATRGTPEEKLALLNSFDPAMRQKVVRAMPPQALIGLPELRREAMAASQPQQLVNSELIEQKLYRALYSNRQLEEVLADFWVNHFNVFNGKGPDRVLLTSFERDAIRPYVLGHFKDMLLATARHPAMLFYLDNWQSQAPREDLPPLPVGRRPGLNENYGRELMELHTLGVDGGYTQDDVIAVARAFTGWTIYDQQKLAEFQFNPAVHDRKEKRVLGHTLPPMQGEQDGIDVIDILAHHPSTARFISKKLAQRFVADDPPQALIDRMATTFTKTDGDLRAVLQTMFKSPEFLSEGAFQAKVKSPLEMVLSAVRSLNAEVTDPFVLAQRIADLAQPLYGKLEPTGYPNTAEGWTNTAGILGRINFATTLTAGQIPGVKIDVSRIDTKDPSKLASDLLSTPPSPALVAALEKGLRGREPTPAVVTTLIIGSPDFQKR